MFVPGIAKEEKRYIKKSLHVKQTFSTPKPERDC